MFKPTVGLRLTRLTGIRFSLLTFLATCTLLVVGPFHFTPVAHASGGGGSQPPLVFVHTATAANSSGDSTMLDEPSLPPSSTFLQNVTPNWTSVYDNHPIGVFYAATHWYIFNQDLALMPIGAAFTVWVTGPFDTGGFGAFMQTATSANSFSDYTVIDNPATNNNPKALLLATPNWNPGGVAGVYENHNFGVYYFGTASSGRWAIFNQDRTAIPPGAAFNLYIIA